MTAQEPDGKNTFDRSAADSHEGPAGQSDYPTLPTNLNAMFALATYAVQAGYVGGDMTITATPSPLEKIIDQVHAPVMAFLANFEICLAQVGDMQAQLDLIPRGMWPVIDTIAYGETDRFLNRADLRKTPLLIGNGDVRESLAFLMKVAWERGYFMAHFHRLKYIPHPICPVEPLVIMDMIVAEGDLAHPGRSLGNTIEVTLQRAVSMCTALEPTTRTLQTLGNDLHSIVQPHLDMWSDQVRTVFAYGILAARAETIIGMNPPSA